jgi:ectoine hydroxylase-related dioxygenase (phytanoyl-CoA dioxygenase family)
MAGLDVDVKQYREEGYTVVRQLIPRDLVDALAAYMKQVLAGEHDQTLPRSSLQVVDPSRYRNPRGGHLVLGYQKPASSNAMFAQVRDHPRLVEAMAQLLGGPVVPFTDQALAKPAAIREAQGGCTFYHQDSRYWRIAPELGANAWIALCDVGRDAIALGMCPGSHKGWQLAEHESYFDDPALFTLHAGKAFERHRIPASMVDMSRDIVLPMAPGDAAFFTNYTWHRAEPNRSGQDKCAYAVAYQRADAARKPNS